MYVCILLKLKTSPNYEALQIYLEHDTSTITSCYCNDVV